MSRLISNKQLHAGDNMLNAAEKAKLGNVPPNLSDTLSTIKGNATPGKVKYTELTGTPVDPNASTVYWQFPNVTEAVTDAHEVRLNGIRLRYSEFTMHSDGTVSILPPTDPTTDEVVLTIRTVYIPDGWQPEASGDMSASDI